MTAPLLEAVHMTVTYPSGIWKETDKEAVKNVTFALERGKTLGVIGESGCGKSTLAKAICHLEPVAKGKLLWKGEDITYLKRKEFRQQCKKIQMIFQDSDTALNPRKSVENILRETLRVHHIVKKEEEQEEIQRLLDQVGLPEQYKERYSSELSGGQRQRIGIARALAVKPELLICDEPLSALDVCTQIQIMELLKTLQHKMGFAMIFIAHGLASVRYLSDQVAVMYLGEVVEYGLTKEVFMHPWHPYTRALFQSHPVTAPRERYKRELLSGEACQNEMAGCIFSPRCGKATQVCYEKKPVLQDINRHYVSCFLAERGEQLSDNI